MDGAKSQRGIWERNSVTRLGDSFPFGLLFRAKSAWGFGPNWLIFRTTAHFTFDPKNSATLLSFQSGPNNQHMGFRFRSSSTDVFEINFKFRLLANLCDCEYSYILSEGSLNGVLTPKAQNLNLKRHTLKLLHKWRCTLQGILAAWALCNLNYLGILLLGSLSNPILGCWNHSWPARGWFL